MRSLSALLLLAAAAAALTAQPAPPAQAKLDRLGLKIEWVGAVPLNGDRDRVATVQVADRKQIFVQTTGGSKKVTPEIEFLLELAREFPNFGYVKEELQPVTERMSELSRHRPPIKSVFRISGVM